MFAELKDPVRRKIERYGLTAEIDPAHFFPTVGAAVDAFRAQTARSGPRRTRRGPRPGARPTGPAAPPEPEKSAPTSLG